MESKMLGGIKNISEQNNEYEKQIIKWYVEFQKNNSSEEFLNNLRNFPHLVSKDIRGELDNIIKTASNNLKIKERVIEDKDKFCNDIMEAFKNRFLS